MRPFPGIRVPVAAEKIVEEICGQSRTNCWPMKRGAHEIGATPKPDLFPTGNRPDSSRRILHCLSREMRQIP